MPNCAIMLNENSMARGMASATIRAARMLPRKAKRTAITKIAPKIRFSCTVWMTWLISFVRS